MKKTYKLLIWLFLVYSDLAYSSPAFSGILEKSVEPSPCTTPSCKDAVQKLEERIDSTVKPCDDFYKFVCGNSVDSATSNDETSFSSTYPVPEIQKETRSQLISILEKDDLVNDTKPMKTMKNLYKSCVNQSTIEKQGLAPFLKIMEQFGGWPVLKGETWNDTAFDWTKLIFKLGDKNYWDTTFLPLILYSDERFRRGRLSIYVFEPFWKTPEILLKEGVMNDNATKYFEFMVDMAISMGANETYAKSELNKTYEFENKLANITSFGTPNHAGTQTMGLSEVKERFPFVPWTDYIKSKLPLNVTLNNRYDDIKLFNFEYIINLNALMNSTPKKTVANYFVWKHLYDLKKTFPNVNTVNYHTNNKEKTVRSKEKCLESVLSIMPETLSNLYVHDYLDENTVTNISLMFEDIRSEFTQMFEHAGWIDHETVTALVEKTSSTRIMMGYSRKLVDHLLRDEDVGNFQITDNNNNYFVNWLNAIMYEEKMWGRESDPNVAEELAEELRQWKDFKKYRILPAMFYDLSRHAIFLSTTGYLPMYDYNFPNYINYGRLGFLLGSGIADNFSPDYHTRSLDIWEDINWSVQSEAEYQNKRKCIADQNGPYNPGEWGTLSQDFTNIVGLRATYNAYKKFSMMDKSQELHRKNYTSEQLFWISVGNDFCMEPKALHGRLISQVNRMFSNMEEFSDDFKCSKNSTMNPLNKCRPL